MLSQVGNYVVSAGQRRTAKYGLVLLVVLIIAAVDFGIQLTLITLQVSWILHGIIDGLLVGMFAGALALFLVEAGRNARERIRSEARKAADLNHEIRNALEVLTDAGYLVGDKNLSEAISDSIHRIEQTLRMNVDGGRSVGSSESTGDPVERESRTSAI